MILIFTIVRVTLPSLGKLYISQDCRPCSLLLVIYSTCTGKRLGFFNLQNPVPELRRPIPLSFHKAFFMLGLPHQTKSTMCWIFTTSYDRCGHPGSTQYYNLCSGHVNTGFSLGCDNPAERQYYHSVVGGWCLGCKSRD